MSNLRRLYRPIISAPPLVGLYGFSYSSCVIIWIFFSPAIFCYLLFNRYSFFIQWIYFFFICSCLSALSINLFLKLWIFLNFSGLFQYFDPLRFFFFFSNSERTIDPLHNTFLTLNLSKTVFSLLMIISRFCSGVLRYAACVISDLNYSDSGYESALNFFWKISRSSALCALSFISHLTKQ